MFVLHTEHSAPDCAILHCVNVECRTESAPDLEFRHTDGMFTACRTLTRLIWQLHIQRIQPPAIPAGAADFNSRQTDCSFAACRTLRQSIWQLHIQRMLLPASPAGAAAPPHLQALPGASGAIRRMKGAAAAARPSLKPRAGRIRLSHC